MATVLKYLLMRSTKIVEGDPAASCMSCFGRYRKESSIPSGFAEVEFAATTCRVYSSACSIAGPLRRVVAALGWKPSTGAACRSYSALLLRFKYLSLCKNVIPREKK